MGLIRDIFGIGKDSGSLLRDLADIRKKTRGDRNRLLSEIEFNAALVLDHYLQKGADEKKVIEKLKLENLAKLIDEGFDFAKIRKGPVDGLMVKDVPVLRHYAGIDLEGLLKRIRFHLEQLKLLPDLYDIKKTDKVNVRVRLENLGRRYVLLIRFLKDLIKEGDLMNGAEALLKTVAAAGIDVCFANGGTTEMPMILAFDSITGIRPMLGLFEGVCSGAADGYGRMKEKPALCLLHLGPGLANGVANLHNAKRARTPLLNVIGEHASWHLEANAPLAMDIDCLCKTFSGWQRTVRSVATIAQDTADAIEASLRGQIASLIVPCDLQWKEYRGDIPSVKSPACDPPDRRVIESAAKLLKSAEKTALIMNGRALRRRGLEAAGRIRAAVGCDLFCINFPAYVDRGAGTVPVARVPYFPEPAAAVLAPYKAVVLAGTDEPVNFFGYEGQWSNPVAADVPKLRIEIDSRMRPKPWRRWPTNWAHPAGTLSAKLSRGTRSPMSRRAS